MNDWLDYQGSGSSRAYASNTLSHAFLGIESRKEREARLKDQKEKQSKAESALIDSQFDLARKYQTEYNQNKDKLTKAKKSADDLYSRYSETAAQLTKLEKQQREMSSSGVSQEVLRRNVPIIPQLRNKKEVLNNKYQEAYAKYTELRDRQKWLDNKLKSIAKYFDADGHIEGYGSVKQSYFDMPADDFIEHADVSRQTNGYDYLNSRLSELTKQEDELVALAGEAANLMNTAYGKLRTAYGKIQIIDKKMATMDKAGWDIEESINRGNFSAMQKEALTNKLNSIGKRGQAKLAAMYVPIDTVDDIRSSLQSALSNFTVVGHSYSGNSDDEFIEHAAKSSAENAREAATVRASIKSTISEMDKLDLAITQLGNQLDRTSRSDLAKSSTAKADALDAREKNIRANAIQKYNEWKKKRSNLVSLISQYERLTSGDSNFIKDAKEYISDPYPTNISDRAFRTLGLWPE